MSVYESDRLNMIVSSGYNARERIEQDSISDTLIKKY